MKMRKENKNHDCPEDETRLYVRRADEVGVSEDIREKLKERLKQAEKIRIDEKAEIIACELGKKGEKGIWTTISHYHFKKGDFEVEYSVEESRLAPDEWKEIKWRGETVYYQFGDRLDIFKPRENWISALEAHYKIAKKAREDRVGREFGLEFKQKFEQPKTFSKASILKFPPCMRKLLATLERGENIPHAGRFALTAFLHAVGMSADDILKMFSSTPDFDKKKTRYQVEHITGKISGIVYTPPECAAMKTYGLCSNEDLLCKKEWLTHPLKYYRAKERSASKGKE